MGIGGAGSPHQPERECPRPGNTRAIGVLRAVLRDYAGLASYDIHAGRSDDGSVNHLANAAGRKSAAASS